MGDKTKIMEEYQRALKNHIGEVEDLIKRLLPDEDDRALVEDITIENNKYGKGGNTYIYKGEPIITLFGVEFDQVESEDENSVKFTLGQKYFIHNKEKRQEDKNEEN